MSFNYNFTIISVGKFARNSYDKGVDYVFSAPSGSSLFGAAYICPNCFDDGEEGDFDKTIPVNGEQIGERFGHALCSVDITGDGYDDLVVGAPLHSKNRQVSIINHIINKTHCLKVLLKHHIQTLCQLFVF